MKSLIGFHKMVVEPKWFGKRKPKRHTIPFSNNSRAHWATRAAVNKAFMADVMAQCAANDIPAAYRSSVHIRHFTCSPRDRDNLYSSVKALVDGLVRAGRIPDDRDAHIDLTCDSAKVAHRDEERVEIYVRPTVPPTKSPRSV